MCVCMDVNRFWNILKLIICCYCCCLNFFFKINRKLLFCCQKKTDLKIYLDLHTLWRQPIFFFKFKRKKKIKNPDNNQLLFECFLWCVCVGVCVFVDSVLPMTIIRSMIKQTASKKNI